MGDLFRKGLPNSSCPKIENILQESNKTRTEEARGQLPNSKTWFLLRNVDTITEYSSYYHVDMISPHPLLMIAGTEADTRFYNKDLLTHSKILY